MSQRIPNLCCECKHSTVIVFQPPQQTGRVGTLPPPVEALHCTPIGGILPMPVVECEVFEEGVPVEQRTLTGLKDAGEPNRPVPKIVRAHS